MIHNKAPELFKLYAFVQLYALWLPVALCFSNYYSWLFLGIETLLFLRRCISST